MNSFRGTVQDGVVVLRDGMTLPEGAEVSVMLCSNAHQTDHDDVATTRKTIGEKLADLGQKVESMPCDLPADLAANHDHYLHGLPKRP